MISLSHTPKLSALEGGIHFGPTPSGQRQPWGPPPSTADAPLSFLVGTKSVTQEPASEWEGNSPS